MREAPTFYPTEEEFADPLKYINSIRPVAEKCAPALVICCTLDLALVPVPCAGAKPVLSGWIRA